MRATRLVIGPEPETNMEIIDVNSLYTGSDLFKRRQAMHIRRDKPINLKEV